MDFSFFIRTLSGLRQQASMVVGKKTLLSVLLVFGICTPTIAAAAFNSWDDFDVYGNGASISGLNGGTNWLTPWSGNMVVTNAQFDTTPQSLVDNTGALGASRNFATTSTGMIVVSIRRDGTGSNGGGLEIKEGATWKGTVMYRSDSTIKIYNQDTASYESVCNVVANQWYSLSVEFDASTDKYRAACDALPWSTWKGTASAFSGISGINLTASNDAARDIWFDTIRYTLSTTTPPVIVPATTTATTTGNYNGASKQEWLFIACVLIFFVSLGSWGRIVQRV
jgi:hypothetical protein